jgi:30S ribosomal protein S31
MGKGDKRSKKGKIFKGSYGNSRPHKAKKVEVEVKEKVKKPTPRKK